MTKSEIGRPFCLRFNFLVRARKIRSARTASISRPSTLTKTIVKGTHNSMADTNFPPTTEVKQKRRRGAGEGTLFLRKDGRWVGLIYVVDVETGKRKRKAYYGRTRKQAADQLKLALGKQVSGEVIPVTKKTVGEFLSMWLETVVRPYRSRSTYSNYERMIRLHIAPALGHLPLRKLTTEHVQRFLNAIAEKRSRNDRNSKLKAGTVSLIRVVLGAAMKRAVRSKLIPYNPVTDTEIAPVLRTPIEATTPEAAIEIFNAVRGDRLGALFAVYLFMGLRRNEAVGLRWIDVDLETRTLRVDGQLARVDRRLEWVGKPKTAKSRRTLQISE